MENVDRESDLGAQALDRDGLSVVLPAFNEEENILATVEAVRSAVEKLTGNFEILVVDDGSHDRTGAIADALSREDRRVRVIHHSENRGYGAALRSGFAAMTKGFCFYTDTDCQFDLAEFPRLLPLLPGADVVTGFRENRADPFHRRLNAAIYKRMLGALFGLRVRDVDCAFKVYRSQLLKEFDLASNSIFISAEALIKAARSGCVIREVAVTHFPRAHGKQTGNSPATLIRALREFVRISPGLRATPARRNPRGPRGDS
ncbi:MAG TPA: glycosyltransferase family 2 protein [Verrucomicrobiae bacterium]|nr:glycosyltransferase family 2 protein [Verrucomicrobiae bacterium]